MSDQMIYSGCGCEVIEHFPDFCPFCKIEQLEAQNINCNTLIDKLNERIEQLETPTYRSEWNDLAKLHEEFKQHIAKQAKIIAAVEAVLIDHKGFHYGDNAVSVLCALEDALKGICNVQNIR